MNQEEDWLVVGERLTQISDSLVDAKLDNTNLDTKIEVLETHKSILEVQGRLLALGTGQGLLILLVIVDILARVFFWQ